jgi:hypothetical protein
MKMKKEMKYKKSNWINIILTCILYSDYSKTKLISKYRNELLKKINNNLNLTKKNYKEIFDYLNLNEKFIKNYLYYLFLPKFIEKLELSYITLDYYKNNFYVNISENQIFNKDYIEYKFDNLKKISSDINPDYLIINLWTGSYQKTSYTNNIDLISRYIPQLAEILTLKNYNKTIKDFKDEIIFNNDIYKLDSCILENNKGITAGITYNKNKYIYAISYDNDNNKNKTKFIKYDWDFIYKNGYKTLIYIKTTNNKMKPDKTKKDIIIKKQSKKDLKDIIKSLNTDIKIFKENGNVKGTENGKYKQMKIFYKYLRDKYKENKENKKTKMTKEDYIKIIKKQYPYYVYLNKYKIDELKEISERVCNNIYINYDGYNSCYIDSLMVALFNTKNDMIRKILLDAPLKYYDNCPELLDYGNEIREELIKIYITISMQKKNSQITKCTNFRLLMQKYYDAYKTNINKKYDKIEWTRTQNDYSDILTFLTVIFDIPHILKYKINDRIEERYFVDLFPLDELLKTDKIYIKDFYPKYTKIMEYENSKNELKYHKDTIEYLSSKFLFILINRKILEEKLETKIIPALKLKLKENPYNLYLNSIIIHQGGNDGGHFICLYECKGIWYEYNDLNVSNKYVIGTLEDIINNDYYTENIVGLFYT